MIGKQSKEYGGSSAEGLLSHPDFDRLGQDLARMSVDLSGIRAWPAEQFRLLSQTGVLGWVIPREYGGSEVSSEELMCGYEQLAEACLVTTFVLTQRNGACQRIAAAENEELKRELLPPLCQGETFATVGVSHLTTSRQHLRNPAVTARQTDRGFLINGAVPWVTGANAANYIVTGGTCDDGRQVLAVVPTSNDGVVTDEPVEMLAMEASQTGPVELHDVEIDAHHLIAGPIEGVMKSGKGGGAGSLTTSALAIGTATGALCRLRAEVDKRPDLDDIYQPLQAERDALFADLLAVARGTLVDEHPALGPESVRRRANSLVLRATQAYLGASKGAGFVKGHPAERSVREAMFFLVWSCPQPVLNAALREFACLIED